ncbi:hypothetical protein HDU67_000155 [Dinochytrium kinnereticum]|nr:hypothetical protein HDU67_000155 [Dinochytrium kinnereticum]
MRGLSTITSLLLTLPLLTFTPQASATVTLSSPPTATFHNYDFPGFDFSQPSSRYSFTSRPALASFLDPKVGGRCKLDMNSTFANGTGEILIINPALAIAAGCRAYEDIPGLNGWYEKDLVQPFKVAVVILQKPSRYCCLDDGFVRVTAQYNLTPFGRFQDSSVIMTGISVADGTEIVKALKNDPAGTVVTVDSDNATDEGTLLLKTKTVKAYIDARLVLYILLILFELLTSIRVIFRDGLQLNLKWAVSILLHIWTIGLLVESIIFFRRVNSPEGFPYTVRETTMTTALRWGGFIFGFTGFSLMLLVWAKACRGLGIRDTPAINFMRRYFSFINIACNVIVGVSLMIVIAFIVTPVLDKVHPMIKITAINFGVCLSIQAFGYTYYAYQILSQTRRADLIARRSVPSTEGNRGASSGGVGWDDMNIKLTMLAVAVIFNWVVLTINILVQTFFFLIQIPHAHDPDIQLPKPPFQIPINLLWNPTYKLLLRAVNLNETPSNQYPNPSTISIPPTTAILR